MDWEKKPAEASTRSEEDETAPSSSEKYFCLVFDHPKIVRKEKMISVTIAYDEVISTSSNGDVTPVQNWRKNAIVPRLDDLLSPVEDAVDGFQDSLLQQFIAKFDNEEDLKPLFKLGRDKSQFSGNALYDHLASKRAENVEAQVTLRFARWAKSEFGALIAPSHLLPRSAPDPQSSQTESLSALTPTPTGTAAIVSHGTPTDVETPGTAGTPGATPAAPTAAAGEDEQTAAAASDTATAPPGLLSVNEVGSSAPKKYKSFATMLDVAQYQEAERELLVAAKRFIGTGQERYNSKLHRAPDNINRTWNKEALGASLKAIRNQQLPKLIQDYTPTNRSPVVIAMRLGTGFGKTHILTEAHELLGITSSVYITYNHQQNLSKDTQEIERATLLRLILACHGGGSLASAQFLTDKASCVFFNASVDGLENLALFSLRKLADGGDVVVCIDEMASLVKAAPHVVSLMSNLCHLYFKATGAVCVVLVSSLTAKVFVTKSGRTVVDWLPDRATFDTIQFFARQLHDDTQDLFIALSKSICGTHLRSIAICFNEMLRGSRPSIATLFKAMEGGLGVKLPDDMHNSIIERVKTCMTSEHPNPDKTDDIEELLDGQGTLCPAFIQFAFSKSAEGSGSSTKEQLQHLTRLFQSFAAVHADGKGLEVVSMHFDLFRASLHVPVVPTRAKVYVPVGLALNANWYRQLIFPDPVTVSEEDLLKTEMRTENGRSTRHVVATDTQPVVGMYYHPSTSGHPYIDRAFVALHQSSGELCLILTRAKVNDDFSVACKAINTAATLLSSKWKFTRVLLVITVLGATPKTRAQDSLEWPYILVRGKDEVSDFYSVNFADLVWFAREEHLLKNSKLAEPPAV